MEPMLLALEEARKALDEGEIPVGAVLMRGEEVLWADHNRREQTSDPTAHAEILCLREGARKTGDWRLSGCDLYVTLEPCPMCAGAILNARVNRVFYGTRDSAMGATGGVLNLFMEDFPHHPQLVGGILEADCRGVLQEFFGNLRQ